MLFVRGLEKYPRGQGPHRCDPGWFRQLLEQTSVVEFVAVLQFAMRSPKVSQPPFATEHSSTSTQPVGGFFGRKPAPHGRHRPTTPSGPENVPSAHGSHAVKSVRGPSPLGQALHWLAISCTTLGCSHAKHSKPNDENRPAAHDTQSDRAAFGSFPASHVMHMLCCELLTLPCSVQAVQSGLAGDNEY